MTADITNAKKVKAAITVRRVAFAIFITLILLLVSQAVAQGTESGQLTEQEKRGKTIYLRGISPSGKEITCFLGDETTEVPATAMLCANCHGFDGRGNPEGGVTPSDITWEGLTKAYGVTHANGRKHPPYTERTLELSIVKGVDPSGNHLSSTMPLYSMSRQDMADLVAYLKRLGKDVDPGLSDTGIRVGTILPATGQPAEMGYAVKAALAAYFAEVNAQGGVYNRKIELRIAEAAASPSEARANAARFIDQEQVFAMTAAFSAGADKEIIALAEEKEVPMIGPFTLYPEIGYPLNRHIFYLFSGLKDQSGVLVKFVTEKTRKQSLRIAIICPDAAGATEVAASIEQECKKRGYNSTSIIRYARNQFDPARLAGKMREANTEVILSLASSQDVAAVMRESDKLGWNPYVLMPGALAGKEILDAPQSFRGKIFLSFPTLPSDQVPEAVIEYRALAEKYKLSPRHLASQLSAYCAARILVEGLKLAGKELSREKLIKALEGFYEFNTGLIPAITYGPNRRIGAIGAYVVAIDLEKKQFVPASGWLAPD